MELTIFISHDWQDDKDYRHASAFLNRSFPEGWRDLSVPRSKAITFARTKKDAWKGRLHAVESEKYGLLERTRMLEQDIARVAKLASLASPDSTIRGALDEERRKLDALSAVLPNLYARERYVAQPMADLKSAERALESRDLLDSLASKASVVLSNEIIAAQSSISAIDQVLGSLIAEVARFETDEELVELPATSFLMQKMPPHRTLTVDRLLAEQLSALVAQSSVVLLLINDFGMFKPWIHFELTLAVRHRRPIVAIPTGIRGTESAGLMKDLATFGAVVSNWHQAETVIRRYAR